MERSQVARLVRGVLAEADKAKNEMYYCIYLLLSAKDKRSYLGSTDNLPRRLKEHYTGKCKATAYRRPLKLIYTENFDNLADVRLREKYLKSRKGRKELKEIFTKLNIGA